MPVTIRSQRSSIGSMWPSVKVRCGWSCMQSRHWTTASWTSSTRSVKSPDSRVDAQDRVVVDLGLEVLGPAAVAAQPGAAVAASPRTCPLRRAGGLGLGPCLSPPIRLMVRGGWRKPGSVTWCLSSLRHTASRIICSSSSSSAPSRSGSRRSVSCMLNRHVRSLPSAVSRMRLQSPQNGSDTGLMKPISPLPSANRYTRAVECGSRGCGSSG